MYCPIWTLTTGRLGLDLDTLYSLEALIKDAIIEFPSSDTDPPLPAKTSKLILRSE